MPFLMEDYYKGYQGYQNNQLNQQKIQDNDLIIQERKAKLAALLKAQADEKAANDIQTNVYNETPQPGQSSILPGEWDWMKQQQPAVQVPEAPITTYPYSEGGGQQPGTVPEGFAGAPTQIEPAAPAQPIQPQLVQATKDSAQALNDAALRVAQNKKIEDQLRRKGYHAEADAFAAKNVKAAQEQEDLETKHLSNTIKVSEAMAGYASGYLEAVKRPGADENAAWTRTLLRAQADGFDITPYIGIKDPEQRKSAAEQLINSTANTKEASRARLEYLKEEGRNKRATAALESRQAIEDSRTQEAAKSRELRRNRLDWEKEKTNTVEERRAHEQRYKEIKATAEAKLNQSKLLLVENDKELAHLETRMADLQKGNLLIDHMGAPLNGDEEAIAAESDYIRNRLNNLRLRKRDLINDVEDTNLEVESLVKSAPKGVDVKTPVAKEVPTEKPKEKAGSSLPPKQLQDTFLKDPATKGMVLGKKTAQGWEVLDTKKNLMGYYN